MSLHSDQSTDWWMMRKIFVPPTDLTTGKTHRKKNMTIHDHSPNPAPSDRAEPSAAFHLVPPGLTFLVEERHTLWTESAEEYDALQAAVFAELEPKGIWESILVKDLVDYIWEVRRMRRLKVTATHAQVPAVAVSLLFNYSAPVTANSFGEEERISRLARCHVHERESTPGSAEERESFAALTAKKHVTPDVLHYEAYRTGYESIEGINRELTRLEGRRDQIMAQFEDRRTKLAAMAKGLLKREAEDIELVSGA